MKPIIPVFLLGVALLLGGCWFTPRHDDGAGWLYKVVPRH